jgi:hypothetical protein
MCRTSYAAVCISAVLLSLGACDDDKVKVYTVKKPASTTPATSSAPTPSPAAPGAGAAGVAEASDALGITWTLPDGWSRVEGDRPMRVATFTAGEQDRIEIALTRFPGTVGGDLANMNRWRNDVRLEPITGDKLEPMLVRFDSGTWKGYTTRVRGEQRHMIVAAVHDPAADQTWFVRATTTPDLADRHEESVYAFARSLRPAADKDKP